MALMRTNHSSRAMIDRLLGESFHIVNKVAGSLTEIRDVAYHLDQIQKLNRNGQYIETVAGDSVPIHGVYQIRSQINAIAPEVDKLVSVFGSLLEITGVYGIRNQVTGVYGKLDQIQTVYDVRADVTTVAGIDTEVVAVAAVNAAVAALALLDTEIAALAAIEDKLVRVDGIGTEIGRVDAIRTAITNLDAIRTELGNLNTIRNQITNLEAVRNQVVNLEAIKDEISSLEAIKNAVSNLDAIKDDVSAVAGIDADVEALATLTQEIEDLGAIKIKLEALHGSLTELNQLYTDRVAILEAGDWGRVAKDWASEDEDTIVDDGKYSSLHYAAKSESFATDAETALSNIVTQITIAGVAVYEDKAAMVADSGQSVGTLGLVYNDSNTADNGYYEYDTTWDKVTYQPNETSVLSYRTEQLDIRCHLLESKVLFLEETLHNLINYIDGEM